jgi:TonB-linked SusC/RagA family outer membrane protein
MKKTTALLLLLMLFVAQAFAQNKNVTGTVTTEKGEPVSFASIVIKGKRSGVTADADGRFSLQNVPKGTTLVISGVGYLQQEIVFNNENTISVSLKSKGNDQLNEVIVTSLGIKRQPREVGFSTARIKADELTQAKIIDLATGLSAKIAGLQINLVNNGVNPDVRIVSRGNHSLAGNNQALIVLDGSPISSSFLKSINPNDLENITLLKGPSASALYGIEAANGVLVLTSKKGTKGKQPVIKLTNTTQLERISYFPDIQTKYSPNGGERTGFTDPITGLPVRYDDPRTGQLLPVPFENQNFGSAYNSLDYPYSQIAIGGPVNGELKYGPYSANKKNRTGFFQSGITIQNDISYSGGDEKGSFFLSLQDVNVKGVVPDDTRRRTGGRFSASKEYGKFSANFNLGYSQVNLNQAGNDFTSGAPVYFNVLNQPAHLDLNSLRNVDTDPFSGPSGFINAYYGNPWWAIKHARNKRRTDDVLASINLGLQATNWLSFSYRVGYSQSTTNGIATTDQVKFTPEAISDLWGASSAPAGLVEVPAAYESKKLTTTDLNADFLINLNKKFNNISARMTLGNNIRQRNNSITGFGNANLAIPGLNNINNRQGDPQLYDARYERRDLGFYGDATVGYKDFLFVHGSYREDIVSILDKDNRSFGYFGVDGSFVLTDAFQFLNKIEKLSFAKVRLAYSETGNASIVGNVGFGGIDPFVFSNLGAYRLENPLGAAGGYPYGTLVGYTQGFVVVQKGLRPERTKAFEAGLQLGFLKDKIGLELTYFKDRTIDQTTTAGITTSTGAAGVLLNAGQLGVKGIEADLKLNSIVDTKNFKVSVGANYSYTTNKVIEILPGVTELQLAGTGVGPGVGGPGGGIYAIVGLEYPVIKTNDWLRDANGKVIVNALNGYPSADPVLKVFGNTNHKHRLGINTNITWKRFSFVAVADYRGGAKILNIIGPTLDFTGSSGTSAQTRERFVFPNSVYLDATGKSIDNTNITTGDANAFFWASVYRRIGSNYVNNAAFWKLREVSISYDIPQTVFAKTKIIKRASFTVSGRNLLRFLPKTNVWSDPEFAVNTGNAVGRTAVTETPPTRIFSATLNVTF